MSTPAPKADAFLDRATARIVERLEASGGTVSPEFWSSLMMIDMTDEQAESLEKAAVAWRRERHLDPAEDFLDGEPLE